jgi:GT2 family glycosyltransferase
MSKIAVVLLNWNSTHHTINCLKSFEKVKSKHDIELVIFDNASSDENITSITRKFPKVNLLRSTKNLGFTGGNNEATRLIRDAGFDYFLFLNNDTFVSEDFIDRLVAVCQDHSPSVVQPLICFADQRDVIWNAGGKLNRLTGQAKTISYKEKLASVRRDNPYEIDWFTGCCVLVPDEIIRKENFFKEDYFAYFEDVETSLRLKDSGVKILIDPGALIFHVAGGSGKHKEKNREGNILPILHYYNIRNNFWTIRLHRNYFSNTAIVYQAFKALSMVLYFVFRGRFKKMRMALNGIKEGLFIPTNKIG